MVSRIGGGMPVVSRRTACCAMSAGILGWAVPTIPRVTLSAEPKGSESGVNVKQVQGAWQKRQDRIKSFGYECALESLLVKGSRNRMVFPARERQGEDVPKSDVVLRGTFAFSLSGEKMAYSARRDYWEDQSNSRKTQTFRAAFDGVHHKQLGEIGSLAMGSLEAGGKPGDILTHGKDEVALWLWFSPMAVLQRILFDPSEMKVTERMTVSQGQVERDGHACAEVLIPGLRPSVRTLVYVDLGRDYVPLQLVQEWDGVPGHAMFIQYVRDEGVGWRVSAWIDNSFLESGAIGESTRYKVTRFSVNKPIDQSTFTFEFPKGAHIAETAKDGAGKFFIALGNGKRQYIPESEFGALPPQR